MAAAMWLLSARTRSCVTSLSVGLGDVRVYESAQLRQLQLAWYGVYGRCVYIEIYVTVGEIGC